MLEHIEKALEYLDKANLQGYFEEMDKVKMSPELVRQYNRQKNIFIKGKEPNDFEQRLQVLAEAVRHLFVKIGETVLFTVYEYERKLTYYEAQRHDILIGLLVGLLLSRRIVELPTPTNVCTRLSSLIFCK